MSERLPQPNQPGLKPNDAIHLASAKAAKCDILLSYDPDLTKQKDAGIKIEWPERIAQQQGLPYSELTSGSGKSGTLTAKAIELLSPESKAPASDEPTGDAKSGS